MDKMIHVALNNMKNIRNETVLQAQNIANISVSGYRRDISAQGGSSFLEAMGEFSSRAYVPPSGKSHFSNAPGLVTETGAELDLAFINDGYFYIQPDNGAPALSRRGDLKLNADRILVNGADQKVLDSSGAEIFIPEYRYISIGKFGEITIEPAGGLPGVKEVVAEIGITTAAGADLSKEGTGFIRMSDGSALPAPDQLGQVVQGSIEGSNVNTVDELVSSIDTQRAFEIAVKFVKQAQEIDERGTEIMRMPNV